MIKNCVVLKRSGRFPWSSNILSTPVLGMVLVTQKSGNLPGLNFQNRQIIAERFLWFDLIGFMFRNHKDPVRRLFGFGLTLNWN
jgi:hypothetical protein